MSTGKRIAKRSIIGTRVCAPGEDGKFYSGVIHAVKTPNYNDNIFSTTPTTSTFGMKYSVRFDHPVSNNLNWNREYKDVELIGPGFQSIQNFQLVCGQKIFLTFNGREICGEVINHDVDMDEVNVKISPPGFEGIMDIKKRLEEIRLLESRKSLRLMDTDTDFARLADMGGDRKRPSHNIDVPILQQGSRKRRTSTSQDEYKEEMNECTAALVLMKLSGSPHSPSINGMTGLPWAEPSSPSPSFSDGGISWRSSTPSPPLSDWMGSGTTIDEGIVMDDDFDELPKKKKFQGSTNSVASTSSSSPTSSHLYQCTWPKCYFVTASCATVEDHVRQSHLKLGPKKDRSGDDDDSDLSDHEEEFYYTEVEFDLSNSPPTLSHMDMCRPPREDPDYQKNLSKPGFLGGIPSSNNNNNNNHSNHQTMFVNNNNININGNSNNNISNGAGPIPIPKTNNFHQTYSPWSFSTPSLSPNSPQKYMKLAYSAPMSSGGKIPSSPTRRARGDSKKCRKVYGMEHRDLWCTQCKWKKACSRFGD